MVSNDLNFLEALVYLSKKDKILEKVIKEIKPKEPEKREPNFEALVKIISGQQLSSAAASTIFNRLKEFIGKNKITPQLINNCKPQQILKCGLSNAKTQYILNLSDMFLAKPNILNELKDKESNEIIEGLQKFKGIGIWSASIFALFYLNHPSLAPHDGQSKCFRYRLAVNAKYMQKAFLMILIIHEDRSKNA